MLGTIGFIGFIGFLLDFLRSGLGVGSSRRGMGLGHWIGLAGSGAGDEVAMFRQSPDPLKLNISPLLAGMLPYLNDKGYETVSRP